MTLLRYDTPILPPCHFVYRIGDGSVMDDWGYCLFSRTGRGSAEMMHYPIGVFM